MTPAATLLVLAEPTEATSVRLTLLARRLGRAVRLVSPAELALAPRWVHRVGGGTRTGPTSLTLRDGGRIADDEIAGVFNRLWELPEAAFARFDARDRAYARAELHALVVSWLSGLRGRVMNPATPYALCGTALSAAHWQLLAHRAGFDTTALRFTTSQRRFPAPGMVRVDRPARAAGEAPRALDAIGPAALAAPAGKRSASLLLVGGTVWPEGLDRAEAAPLVKPCRRLARAAVVTLLRVHLGDGGGAWRFASADAAPDVSDERALTAILDVLSAPPSSAPRIAARPLDAHASADA